LPDLLPRDSVLAPVSFPALESAYIALLRLATEEPQFRISPRVLDLLRRETDSKRAFIPVFAAEELADEANPDVACLAGLHFLPRDGRLHIVCSMRANDLDCGLLSDVFSFTMIQEFAAVQLGLGLGTYTHYMGSAHVNDRDADRVSRVLQEAATRTEAPVFPFPSMPATTTASTIAHVLEHEELLRTNKAAYGVDDIAALGLAPYWRQALLLFEVHRQITHEKVDFVDTGVLGALDPGLRWLLARRWPACDVRR
jgi:thymidylate synthase